MENKDIISEAFFRHYSLLENTRRFCMIDIYQCADLLVSVLKSNKKILIAGNGGSAADSQHFAAEWLCRYKNDRHPLPAIALTTDTSTLTAISNDYDFHEIFSRQIMVLGAEGDVLILLTTSGQSKNILRAIEVARSKNIKIIVLTGERGSTLRTIVDSIVVIPGTETARIQEMHEIVYHAWCEYVDNYLKI